MGGNGDLIARYRLDQERRGLLPSTMAKRTAHLRLFARWLDGPLFDATTEQLQLFLDGRHLAARSRYSWISDLAGFYAWATREELTDHDPTARVLRPKLRRLLPRPINEHDLRAALDLAPPMMRAWLLLAAGAGLRCAEIAGLERDSVLEHHEPAVLRILGKGGTERIVPAHPLVLEAMRRVGLPRSGYVFTKASGHRYTPAQVSRAVALYFDGLGIDATAHQLRHGFATAVYSQTSDLRLVQELLGHSSPTTTAGYAAYSPRSAALVVSGLALDRRRQHVAGHPRRRLADRG